ncbi:helix-turn-helix domain-containing protein [Halovivax gelatinilyticus]|uniref:helix-turn-helix domain-containing protein n=1 Tax=Halovivax gelatinilyticus TaxID=2961597 RepID=UPI0020CA4152|nr:helix-turn-helix domain-containing protein [Halovivax gelatinilyticus]
MVTPTDATVDGQVLLTNPVRRRICSLLARERSISLSTLASRLVDGFTDGSTSLERMRVDLHHNHLPRLEARGLVTYAFTRKTVSIPSSVVFDDESIDGETYARFI